MIVSVCWQYVYYEFHFKSQLHKKWILTLQHLEPLYGHPPHPASGQHHQGFPQTVWWQLGGLDVEETQVSSSALWESVRFSSRRTDENCTTWIKISHGVKVIKRMRLGVDNMKLHVFLNVACNLQEPEFMCHPFLLHAGFLINLCVLGKLCLDTHFHLRHVALRV